MSLLSKGNTHGYIFISENYDLWHSALHQRHPSHPANLRWVRDGSPWPTNWTQLEKQLLACSLPEEIQQSQNIPSITSSSPHTWYLTTWHDDVSSRHCESLCLIFLLLKKLFKSCRGQTGRLRFSQHVVGVLKEHDAKKTLIYFHIQVTTSQLWLLMIYYYYSKTYHEV